MNDKKKVEQVSCAVRNEPYLMLLKVYDTKLLINKWTSMTTGDIHNSMFTQTLKETLKC